MYELAAERDRAGEQQEGACSEKCYEPPEKMVFLSLSLSLSLSLCSFVLT